MARPYTRGSSRARPTGSPTTRAKSCQAWVTSRSPLRRRCWMQQEPARKLVNLQNIPLLIVTAEASYHAAYDHCTAAYLTQAGVRNTFLRLADAGIRGNGHMMMLEKNSDAIAAVMADWLKKNVPATSKPRQAAR